MARYKIAVIGLKGLPAFGGASTVGEFLIENLKNDFDFTVYAISAYTEQKNYKGIKQIIFKNKKKSGLTTFIYYIKSLIHCLIIDKYDLIHLHHTVSGFITPFLKLKYKVILTSHGIYLNKTDPKFNRLINIFFKFCEWLNVKFSDIIISVSKSDKDLLENYYKKKCYYIPNGVYKFNIIEKEKMYDFLFIAARIYEIKGLHFLLNAIKKYNIPGNLLVIGDINQDNNYKEKIRFLSKDLNILFLPLIKDKKNLYDFILSSKIFIFPSLFEAMSMTLLEVIAHKIPVLSSDIESVKNIFDDTELTFFKSGDIDDLALKLKYCLENPDVIKEKSERAYQKVISNYTWDKISEKYKELYNILIKQ